MKLGVVGATGLVGQNFLKLLSDVPFVRELRLFSRRQHLVTFKDQTLETRRPEKGAFEGLDICFFSAGKEASLKWAPQVVREGAIVIDNSSAFRRDKEVPLIVPEVNGYLLQYKPQIIANPNCSTIQLVVAMAPIHRAFGLKTLRVASLQSLSGAGKKALEDLKTESREILDGKTAYESTDYPFAFNCIPFIGDMKESGFCEEEEKIIFETKKIMNLPQLKISTFTVRVPALNSHGEVIWCSLENPPAKADDLGAVFKNSPGLAWEESSFPHPRKASGQPEVFVGRIHRDPVAENSWIMWVVADNLLKGASLNGWQIAEKLWQIKKSS